MVIPRSFTCLELVKVQEPIKEMLYQEPGKIIWNFSEFATKPIMLNQVIENRRFSSNWHITASMVGLHTWSVSSSAKLQILDLYLKSSPKLLRQNRKWLICSIQNSKSPFPLFQCWSNFFILFIVTSGIPKTTLIRGVERSLVPFRCFYNVTDIKCLCRNRFWRWL